MKRLFALFLAILCALSLVACSGGAGDEVTDIVSDNNADTEPAIEVTDAPDSVINISVKSATATHILRL